MPLHSLYISWQRKIGARNFLDTERAKLGRDAVFSKSRYPSKPLACHLFPPAEAGAFRVGEDYLRSHKLWVKGIQLNDLFQLDISPPLGVMGQGKEWKEEFTWKHSQSTLCAYSSLTQWIIPFMDAVTSNITHCGGFTHRGSVSQRKIILGMHMPHGSWESWEPNKSHSLTISCCSILQSCLTLCNPMDCSTPGCPVLHHLPEPAQTHVHHVDGAIQPPHPLLPLSLPALNLSQHQGIFQWIGSLHQVAKVLGLQLQHQSSQWILRVDFL